MVVGPAIGSTTRIDVLDYRIGKPRKAAVSEITLINAIFWIWICDWLGHRNAKPLDKAFVPNLETVPSVKDITASLDVVLVMVVIVVVNAIPAPNCEEFWWVERLSGKLTITRGSVGPNM